MLDIDYIRKNKAVVTRQVSERGVDGDKVTEVMKLDEAYRTELKRVEELRAKRNEAAKARDITAGKKLKVELERSESGLEKAKSEFEAKMLELPNLALPDVPVGLADKNKIIKESGTPKKFDFTPRDHLDLGERLGIIDMSSAAKVTGSRFTYLKAAGARLELALVSLSMGRLTAAGFTPVMPPLLIREEITKKLGYWQAGGNENYYKVVDLLSEEDKEEKSFYLIGTGEHAVVPMHEGDILPKAELPRRYAAYSPCFRREAGTYGKDTRGIIRVHQFDKVEMVSFTSPEESQQELEILLDLSWTLMKDLGLPVRQVILSTRDMSFPAAKTVDIETWFPSQNTYRETHSISTTTDFQARRLNTRYIDQGKTGFVHILNGTSFAIGRTLAAILENYQRADGSVEVPKILRSYTGFNEIRPN